MFCDCEEKTGERRRFPSIINIVTYIPLNMAAVSDVRRDQQQRATSLTPKRKMSLWALKSQLWCYEKVLLAQLIIFISLEPLMAKMGANNDLNANANCKTDIHSLIQPANN